MLDVLLDALLDSLKVLGIVFAVYIIISFIETKMSRVIGRDNKAAPIVGSAFGLIPQCGISVVAADLYIKRHITMGTLVATFIACSDEALPIMFAHPNKIIMTLPLLGLKFVIGFIIGFLIDMFFRKDKHVVEEHHQVCNHEEEIHTGCCHHDIDNEEEGFYHKHLLHPIIHSLRIFVFVFLINLLFGFAIYKLGEYRIELFLDDSKYLTPFLAVVVGMIPNCASSIIITELYMIDSLSFGATLGGLIINAGLGLLVLFRDKKTIKHAFIILGILFVVAILTGYITCLIIGF